MAENSSERSDESRTKDATIYTLISICVLLFLVLVIFLVAWLWRKHKKTRSNHGRIVFTSKGTKDVSPPFEDMMDTNKYEFSNPTFIPTPPSQENTIRELSPENLQDNEENTNLTYSTIDFKTPSPVAKMFDNPLYESAENVIRKERENNSLNPLYESVDQISSDHDKLVLNPIYVSGDEAIEVTNKRIWREDRFSQC